MDPKRGPGAVGLNVTAKVQVPAGGTPLPPPPFVEAQLPAARTLLPQLSVSVKSPLITIDEIFRAELPIFRNNDVLGWLTEPTARIENCTREGLIATAGAFATPILATKASVFPPRVFCNAAAVTGKSVEFV